MKTRRAIIASALALLAAAATAQDGQALRSLHHGEVLFHHYQPRWVAALGSLMASQHFGRLSPHEADAELLRGGLLLDWGQHDEAAAVFERVAGDQPAHRDRAWTLLAKARWQRGRVAEADAALARVRAPLPGALDDERLLLLALVHLSQGRPAEAATALQPLAARTPVAAYNQALALLHGGQAEAARQALAALGQRKLRGEEALHLRDRANLTLALQALQPPRVDTAAARGALQRVRLHGPAAPQALLAEGWAALQQGRADQAIVAWTEGAGRPPTDPAVGQARLALPRAYAEAGARGAALDHAQGLARQLADELAALDGARGAVADGRALAPLLAPLGRDEPGRAPEPALPDRAADPQAWQALQAVWPGHDFQQALLRWADLAWSAGHVQRWQQSLPAFADMLALRREGYLDRLPATLAAAADDSHGLAALAREREALQAALQAAPEGGDDFADATERAQLQRLQRIDQALAALPPAPGLEPLRERARLLQGLLRWQLAQTWPARRHTAGRTLHALDAQLQRARDRQAALALAQQQEPQRLAALGQRLKALDEQLAALRPRLLALADEQRAQLQALALAALDTQRRDLARQQVEARLLVAQLLDAAPAAPSGGLAEGASQ